MKTAELGLPLAGDGIRGEPFEERHRDALTRRLRRGSRHLADLFDEFRAGGFRPQHRPDQRQQTLPHLRAVRGRRAGRHVELPRHRRGAAGGGDRLHLLPPGLPRHRLQRARQGHDADAAPSIAACAGSSSGSMPATRAARRRWRRSAGSRKACCAPTGSPGPAMSATRPCSRSSPTNGRRARLAAWPSSISTTPR